MKNKKMTYLLGVLVIVVWGLILYRIFAATNGGDGGAPIITSTTVKETYDDYALPKDTTHLLLNYRDPFGLVKQKDTDTRVKPVRRAIAVLKPAIDWGFIKYSGYIRNPGSKKLVAILSINGKSELLGEGEAVEKVKLLKNMRDSVKVSFNGKIKFITIQH